MHIFTDREYKLLKAALDKEERLYDGIGNYELVQTIKDTKRNLKKCSVAFKFRRIIQINIEELMMVGFHILSILKQENRNLHWMQVMWR